MASGVPSVVTWFQRTVPWSNTPRAWIERAAFLVVVLATAALLLFSSRLALGVQVLAWGTLLVLLAYFLRQGWVFIFGPVLFYDLVRNARRTSNYVIRILIIVVLFGILFVTYWSMFLGDGAQRDPAKTTDIAEFTMFFFAIFLLIQMALVILLTPAYVAGAITEEKERKTIEYILATDLRNREIVLGKYVSRLLHLTMLLITALPILSALQFMGGIDPDLLLAAYAGTGVTMLSIGALSLFASVVSRRTRDAILMVYLFMLAYFGLGGLAWALNEWATGPSGTCPTFLAGIFDWFYRATCRGNPIAALIKVFSPGMVSGTLIWSTLKEYAIFHGSLTALSLIGCMALFRRVALSQPKPRKGRTLLGLGWKRKLPKVGNFPMIWKEIFVERIRWHLLMRMLFVLLVLLSFVPLCFILVSFLSEYGGGSRFGYYRDPWETLGMETNAYARTVGTVVGMLGLIGVAVRAATSVRGEREKDTFDAILTSPMSSEEILFAKWFGSVLSVRWVLLWLVCVWGIGIVTGGINVVMFPLVLTCWLVYAAAAASLGMWFSVTSRNTLQAILKTLFVALAVSCGHWLISFFFCVMLSLGRSVGGPSDAIETVAQMEMGVTPPVVLAMLPFRTDELTHYNSSGNWNPFKMVIFSMGGTFCWAIFAWGVWQATNERFKKLTFRTGRSAPDPFPKAQVVSSWPEK